MKYDQVVKSAKKMRAYRDSSAASYAELPEVTDNQPQECHTWDYLEKLGVAKIPPRTSAFDPGYDPATLISHLRQSSHLISSLKISMACWQVADEKSTRRKIHAANRLGIPVCTGGGPFEVASHFNMLPEYLDLCASLGIRRIEAGEGFTDLLMSPENVIRLATERGLQVQFEVGKKHEGAFSKDVVGDLIAQGQRWLDAGAVQIIVEGRESAENIGVFGSGGELDTRAADRFVAAYGLDNTVFEAPDKASQFAMLDHFGPNVHLMNIRLEEILRVEIYRRGIHSDAFEHDNLRPKGPSSTKDSQHARLICH
ncbi:MAG: phosphosulfolactate synthase [Desulfuromonadales bacterium]|nr:phosphosulfolactate synthase [Desulfuromonadales bacterium]